ncbi:threonine ammonia-lyase [Novosphingobium sp. Gsoil 351]|uniref:threonine ammonia-lyase n=1 Tax=Novosphingobium sp. Gsoil 351 TaxID=2675225 RepID=UPI0012B4E7BF|nr:threonine ammonia-lyase [Novosphingobium sp. Gsoil 351]QGN56511.1 threonine ammonia-lyase [Novosphingobium sp. Gsoil 351]
MGATSLSEPAAVHASLVGTGWLSSVDVRAAAARFAGRIPQTPFLPSQTLSELTQAEVWLKFENLQFTGSFKQRGALNTLLLLSEEDRARGVIAISAGNHAQGVAYHAAQLGVPATIVMPRGTPAVKANRTRALGAEVLLHGEDFAEASAALPGLLETRGLTLIHPFDDDRVIAGQGTVALEMLDDRPDLDVIVVPVGGGGLISGVALAAHERADRPRIVGVQSDMFPSMALATGRWPDAVRGGSSIAEGIAVAAAGFRTRQYVEALVDDVLVVGEGAIETAIALLLQIEKTLCEGAGAAGLAAVLSNPRAFAGKRVGLILSGGNIDNRLLTAILRRQQVREGTIVRLVVQLPDRAGSLGRLCAEIGRQGGNIGTVSHDRTFLAADAKSARVEVEVELADSELLDPLLRSLDAEGFVVEAATAS